MVRGVGKRIGCTFGLVFTFLGLVLLNWVVFMAWQDIVYGGKELEEVFFRSVTDEGLLSSLGIEGSFRIIHYTLAGGGFLLLGFVLLAFTRHGGSRRF